MGHLNLCFPEWQGYAESNSVYFGALALREALSLGDFQDIEVPPEEELPTVNNIKGYAANLRQLQATHRVIAEEKPSTIFMVGGTCASEIAPVSWLNKVYDGDLTVIWFDAHGDLNTPESSPSKHFHGMPLRILAGEGDPRMLRESFSTLDPSQIVLAGTRDLDKEEKHFVDVHEVALVTADQMEVLTDIVQQKRNRHVYLHVDLDVLDPESFSHQLLSVPDGLTIEVLLKSLRGLSESLDVVGLSIVEYVPKDETGLSFLKSIANILPS